MIFWPRKKRRLPVQRYQKFYHADGTCYIQVGVVWNDPHFVAQFRRYDDYKANQRLA